MNWPGSIFVLIMLCSLGGLFVKLRRLSRLKTQLHRATVRQSARHTPFTRRSASRRQRRSEYRDADD
ncbi:hypothetical protein CQ001_21140 [Erwinia billingiae]|nr:hypothetical protein CQ001_21140 [Erwinia billingiae]QBR49836.1 hypothetical protein E2F51_07470 [Erwinia sp. QL-Z3]